MRQHCTARILTLAFVLGLLAPTALSAPALPPAVARKAKATCKHVADRLGSAAAFGQRMKLVVEPLELLDIALRIDPGNTKAKKLKQKLYRGGDCTLQGRRQFEERRQRAEDLARERLVDLALDLRGKGYLRAYAHYADLIVRHLSSDPPEQLRADLEQVYFAPFHVWVHESQLAELEDTANQTEEIRKQWRRGFERVEELVLEHSRSLVQQGARQAARDLLRWGLQVSPTARALDLALAELPLRASSPEGPEDAALAETTAALLDECVRILEQQLDLLNRPLLPEQFRQTIAALQRIDRHADVARRLRLEWCEDYLSWMRPDDIRKLAAGQECTLAGWLTADEVAAIEAAHTTMEDPLELDDGVHRIRTNLSYREARTILIHAGAHRANFLAQFGADWDLQRPVGLIPIVVTATQVEHREVSGESHPRAAAHYARSNGDVRDPCYLTMEPMIEDEARLVGMPELLGILRHELTHQIAFEYSEHDVVRDVDVDACFWAIEGLATYMESFENDRGRWVWSNRAVYEQRVPGGVRVRPTALGYCQAKLDGLPTVAELVGMDHEEFMQPETACRNYQMAGALVHFFMTADGGDLRDELVGLLQDCHEVRAGGATWDTYCGDLDDMQDRWITHVQHLELDGRTQSALADRE